MSKHDDRRQPYTRCDAFEGDQAPLDQKFFDEMHRRDDTKRWCWEEAFDKFGYDDGDGRVYTSQVADGLRDAGYCVETFEWPLHNIIIISIRCGQTVLLSTDAPSIRIGYDDPRGYLPSKIITVLDKNFPNGRGWYRF